MRDPGDAIKERLRELGLSQAKFSRMVGKSPGWAAARFLPNVENMLRYFAYKEPETIERILRALRWTPEEFAEATGLELVPSYSAADRLGTATIQAPTSGRYEAAGPAEGVMGMPVEVYTLPLVQAGAGPPWYQDEAETITLALPELKYPRDKLFVVRIVGDSMSPYLEDGDLAVVYQDPGLAAKGKAVAVWLADDGVVIKRFLGETEDGQLYLGNDNPTYPPFLAPQGSRIVGVVVKRVKEG